MNQVLKNLFRAYFKHLDYNDSKKAWSNLKQCEKCKLKEQRLNKVVCNSSKESAFKQIKEKCPINKF